MSWMDEERVHRKYGKSLKIYQGLVEQVWDCCEWHWSYSINERLGTKVYLEYVWEFEENEVLLLGGSKSSTVDYEWKCSLSDPNLVKKMKRAWKNRRFK